MIVKKEQNLELEDIEVLVRYAKTDDELRRLLAMLEITNKKIYCLSEDEHHLIDAADVYYIESVDKKTFVYLKSKVYRTDKRLYQLKEELANANFVQVNKSCILNLNVLQSLTPLFNSRMEALLSNGERVLVTRKFLAEIRDALQKEVV